LQPRAPDRFNRPQRESLPEQAIFLNLRPAR
jgi:hypothetical protein